MAAHGDDGGDGPHLHIGGGLGRGSLAGSPLNQLGRSVLINLDQMWTHQNVRLQAVLPDHIGHDILGIPELGPGQDVPRLVVGPAWCLVTV